MAKVLPILNPPPKVIIPQTEPPERTVSTSELRRNTGERGTRLMGIAQRHAPRTQTVGQKEGIEN